jgi:hypothetical protein
MYIIGKFYAYRRLSTMADAQAKSLLMLDPIIVLQLNA